MKPADYVYDENRVSPSCAAFIRGLERAHEEWQRRRAQIHGWVYDKVTGMAVEPAPVKRKRAA